MEKVYLVTDEGPGIGVLNLINRGLYRAVWQAHLNIKEGRSVDYGLDRDYVSGVIARDVITPILLETGIFDQDSDGKLTTEYYDLVIKDPKLLRNDLIASMEHNVRDMCRYAITLKDSENSRGTGYLLKRGCNDTIIEGIAQIKQGFGKVLNAPLNEDDSKNIVVEIAVITLRELINNA